MSVIVDRYAPSPTSDLHVGNLRTALAGWLLTRAGGGKWLMRVEDLDAERVRAAGTIASRQLAELASREAAHPRERPSISDSSFLAVATQGTDQAQFVPHALPEHLVRQRGRTTSAS